MTFFELSKRVLGVNDLIAWVALHLGHAGRFELTR